MLIMQSCRWRKDYPTLIAALNSRSSGLWIFCKRSTLAKRPGSSFCWAPSCSHTESCSTYLGKPSSFSCWKFDQKIPFLIKLDKHLNLNQAESCLAMQSVSFPWQVSDARQLLGEMKEENLLAGTLRCKARAVSTCRETKSFLEILREV